MAKILPQGKTALGRLLEERRQKAPDPQAGGDSYSQPGVARALRRLGVKMPDRSYASVENETKLVKPEIINRLPEVLPVTVLEMVRAMGFDVAFDGIQGEDEVALLEAYRRLQPAERQMLRRSLGLETGPPPVGVPPGLHRQAAMGRPGHRETPG